MRSGSTPSSRSPSRTSSRARDRRRAAGFTLLELLVVLGIVGIALALVAPSLTSPTRRPEPELVTYLKDARNRAVETGRPVAVHQKDRRIWTDPPAPDGPFELPEARSVEPVGAAATSYLDRARVSVFYPDGTAVLGGLNVNRPGRYGGTVRVYTVEIQPIHGEIAYAYD